MTFSAVQVVDTSPVRLLVAEKVIPFGTVPDHLPNMFQQVYGWLRETEQQAGGLNHAIYQMVGQDLKVRAGVPFDGPVDGPGLTAFTLPAARAAHIRLTGPYTQIREATDRVLDWIKTQAHTPAPLSWEVYGNWSDNPDALVTDIYKALA